MPTWACVLDSDCFLFNPCRKNFRCVGGACYDDPVVCQDQGPCVLSHCDLRSGCVYQPACPDDGLACNGVEFCLATMNGPACQRTSVNCNDADACTIDYCAEPFGCGHDALNCDDGDACTWDTCSPSNGCAHQEAPGCCRGQADCPDQPCQVARACVASFCTAGTPRNCDDGDAGTLDTCNPATGCIHTSTTPTTIPPPCTTDTDCPVAPDACRVSTCLPAQGCVTAERTGIDAVACVCDRPLPASCPGALPRAITRPFDRACVAASRATRGPQGRKQTRLVGRMVRLVARARRATEGKPGHALAATCDDALVALFAEATARAAAFQQGAPR